jgi:hypothetical protein
VHFLWMIENWCSPQIIWNWFKTGAAPVNLNYFKTGAALPRYSPSNVASVLKKSRFTGAIPWWCCSSFEEIQIYWGSTSFEECSPQIIWNWFKTGAAPNDSKILLRIIILIGHFVYKYKVFLNNLQKWN